MKTSLTAVLGHPEINWKAVFTLGKNGDLAKHEYRGYAEKMTVWETCPCGHLSKHIARADNNRPTDAVLYDLGLHINDAFEANEFKNALNLLELINSRGAYLLKALADDLREQINKDTKELEENKKKLQELSK